MQQQQPRIALLLPSRVDNAIAFHDGGVGVRIRLSDELFMGIHAQSGIYLLPTNQKDKLDFPLAGQLSFGFHL